MIQMSLGALISSLKLRSFVAPCHDRTICTTVLPTYFTATLGENVLVQDFGRGESIGCHKTLKLLGSLGDSQRFQRCHKPHMVAHVTSTRQHRP